MGSNGGYLNCGSLAGLVGHLIPVPEGSVCPVLFSSSVFFIVSFFGLSPSVFNFILFVS